MIQEDDGLLGVVFRAKLEPGVFCVTQVLHL